MLECDAEEGAYFVNDDFYDSNYYHSSNDVYKDKNNNFAKAIISAINEYPEYKNSGHKSFWLQPNTTSLSLDKYSLRLMENEVDDYLTRRLSEIWDNLKDDCTWINFKWGNVRSSRNTSCYELFIYEQLRSGLLLKSENGYSNSSECFEDNQINRKILSGGAQLVDVEKNSYNRELLKKIGFHENIEVEDIEQIISRWFNSSITRSAKEYTPYLRAITQYCGSFPNNSNTIKLSKIFYSEKKDKLLSSFNWKEASGENEYSPDLINNLFEVLNPYSAQNYHDIITSIFKKNNLDKNVEEISAGLAELSKYIFSNDIVKIASEFIDKLETIGFIYSNNKITSISNLPIIWNRAPIIPNEDGFITINSSYWKNEELEKLLAAIGWKMSRNIYAEINNSNEKVLEENEAKRVFYVLREILSPLKNDEHSKNIEKLGLFDSIDVIKKRIFKSNKISLLLTTDRQLKLNVPYWFDGNIFIIQSSLKLEKLLPEFIDLECNTTLRSTFKYVWNDSTIMNRESDKTNFKEESSIKESSSTIESNGKNGNVGKSGESFEDRNELNINDRSGIDTTPSGPRKRLYSYVSLKTIRLLKRRILKMILPIIRKLKMQG